MKKMIPGLDAEVVSMKEAGIQADIVEDTIRKVSEYGVNYYILKPYDLNELEKRILETTNKAKGETINLYQNGLDKSITNMLHELGMP